MGLGLAGGEAGEVGWSGVGLAGAVGRQGGVDPGLSGLKLGRDRGCQAGSGRRGQNFMCFVPTTAQRAATRGATWGGNQKTQLDGKHAKTSPRALRPTRDQSAASPRHEGASKTALA